MRDRSIESEVTPWDRCCLLFQVSPIRTDMENKVSLAGLKITLHQYQAFAVYWLMQNSRSNGGGFLADSPGLGKTITFLALLVAERQLAILKAEVKKSRETKDGQHLIPRQFTGEVCPTLDQRPGWILCPCMATSPAYGWDAKSGIRLALLPTPLMSNWRKSWEKAIDTNYAILAMRLYVAHPQLSDVSINQKADFPANINLLKSKKANQEGFLVLATNETYPTWIANFKIPRHTSLNLGRKGIGQDLNIIFGIACADECHEDYNRSKGGRAGIMTELPGNPFCWGLSGTPYSKSARPLTHILRAMEIQFHRDWSCIPHLKLLTGEEFNSACNMYNNLNKSHSSSLISREELDNFTQIFFPFLTTFMIRRTAKSRWLGQMLVPLPKRKHQDITLKHIDTYDQDIIGFKSIEDAHVLTILQEVQRTQWDNLPHAQRKVLERPTFLGHVNNIHAHYQSMILASCPGLINVRLNDPSSVNNFDTQMILSWIDSREEMTNLNPYYRDLKEVFMSSAKLLWVWRFLVKLDGIRIAKNDPNSEEEKVVIISSYLPVIYMVKLVRSSHRCIIIC